VKAVRTRGFRSVGAPFIPRLSPLADCTFLPYNTSFAWVVDPAPGQSTMTPTEFVAKWQNVRLSERSACQQHFCDLCDLLDHPKPAEADPEGTHFTFERGVRTVEGGQGWADVWKRGHFGWEYKRRHRDLKAAYDQLLLYREDLELGCLPRGKAPCGSACVRVSNGGRSNWAQTCLLGSSACQIRNSAGFANGLGRYPSLGVPRAKRGRFQRPCSWHQRTLCYRRLRRRTWVEGD